VESKVQILSPRLESADRKICALGLLGPSTSGPSTFWAIDFWAIDFWAIDFWAIDFWAIDFSGHQSRTRRSVGIEPGKNAQLVVLQLDIGGLAASSK
jgi:hypothetical protein